MLAGAGCGARRQRPHLPLRRQRRLSGRRGRLPGPRHRGRPRQRRAARLERRLQRPGGAFHPRQPGVPQRAVGGLGARRGGLRLRPRPHPLRHRQRLVRRAAGAPRLGGQRDRAAARRQRQRRPAARQLHAGELPAAGRLRHRPRQHGAGGAAPGPRQPAAAPRRAERQGRQLAPPRPRRPVGARPSGRGGRRAADRPRAAGWRGADRAGGVDRSGERHALDLRRQRLRPLRRPGRRRR